MSPLRPGQPEPPSSRKEALIPLKDYTTTVPVQRTIGHIGALLMRAKARKVMTEFDEGGHATGIAFAVETAHGMRNYHLPVNAAAVEKVLSADRQVPPRYQTPEQAERVAWRIVRDWLDAQLAIIATEMVTLDQVMLPYMQGDDGRTVYQLYLDQQLALTAGDTDD